jgi:hypothetical protein
MTYEPDPIETIKDLKPGQPHYGVKRQNIFPDPDHRGFLKVPSIHSQEKANGRRGSRAQTGPAPW